MSEQLLDAKDQQSAVAEEEELQSRRDFLIGLGRWSKVVIGAAVFGGILTEAPDAAAGAWINNRGGGGAWVNNRVGGGAWVNGGGGGGAWVNAAGGGGAWVNNRGGGGAWANRRY
jgi:hypothetical protein